MVEQPAPRWKSTPYNRRCESFSHEQRELPLTGRRLSGRARADRLQLVLTAACRFHRWWYGFLAVLVFALVKEFVIDMFGKEHDSFMSSLEDFAFYMMGAGVAIAVVLLA